MDNEVFKFESIFSMWRISMLKWIYQLPFWISLSTKEGLLSLSNDGWQGSENISYGDYDQAMS